MLLYRLYPLYSWKLHYFSARVYVATRIFVTVTFIYCYIDWALTDRIYDIFHGNETVNAWYMSFFILMPIGVLLLNIAQYQTVKALFYIAKSTRKRIKTHEELQEYPRMQTLYDMFIEFDGGDNGFWTMMDLKRFIFYNATFISHETCVILWTVLGFTYDDETASVHGSDISSEISHVESAETNHGHHGNSMTVDDVAEFENRLPPRKKQRYMKWKHFRAIFGKHVKDEKYAQHSVKQVVSAQLKVLLRTISNAEAKIADIGNDEEREKVISKLFKDVNVSIVENKKRKQAMEKALAIDVNNLEGDAGSMATPTNLPRIESCLPKKITKTSSLGPNYGKVELNSLGIAPPVRETKSLTLTEDEDAEYAE